MVWIDGAAADDYRETGVSTTELSADLKPRATGEVEIDESKLKRPSIIEKPQGSETITRFGNFIAFGPEKIREDFPESIVVFNYKQAIPSF